MHDCKQSNFICPAAFRHIIWQMYQWIFQALLKKRRIYYCVNVYTIQSCLFYKIFFRIEDLMS